MSIERRNKMNIYKFNVQTADGKEVSLETYKGKVVLIVNTATACGLTPQYEGLEKLNQTYKDKGLVILDFPSNQFLEQAPGTNEEIQTFCQTNYNTTFTTFAKVDVNGEDAIPLFKALREAKPEDKENAGTEDFKKLLEELKQTREGDAIKWNCTKFLIDKEGNLVERFSPTVTPEELAQEIEALL